MGINKISGWLNRCAAAFCLVLSTSAIAGMDITTYFHNDVSGTPMLATGSNGQVVWKETYRPYGQKSLTNAAASGSEVGFAGKPFDHNTGLSYMGARYYDPVLGRFTGIDPKEVDPNDLHSFNRYAYANNNPYKYVDPDGRSPLDVAFLMYDLGKLSLAMYSGVGVGAAVADVALSVVGVASPIPGTGQAMKAARVANQSVDAAKIAGTIAANRAKGEAFEQAVVASAKSRGAEVVEQITVKTQSGTRTRLDMVSREADGSCKLIECKSSATAGLTKNQTKAFPEIESSGATVVGQGKGDFPGGMQIAPQKVEIIRPE